MWCADTELFIIYACCNIILVIRAHHWTISDVCRCRELVIYRIPGESTHYKGRACLSVISIIIFSKTLPPCFNFNIVSISAISQLYINITTNSSHPNILQAPLKRKQLSKTPSNTSQCLKQSTKLPPSSTPPDATQNQALAAQATSARVLQRSPFPPHLASFPLPPKDYSPQVLAAQEILDPTKSELASPLKNLLPATAFANSLSLAATTTALAVSEIDLPSSTPQLPVRSSRTVSSARRWRCKVVRIESRDVLSASLGARAVR